MAFVSIVIHTGFGVCSCFVREFGETFFGAIFIVFLGGGVDGDEFPLTPSSYIEK